MDSVSLSDSQARQIVLQTAEVRLTPQYQDAVTLLKLQPASKFKAIISGTSDQDVKDIVRALRVVINTWESIATAVDDLSTDQKSRILFRSTPVLLMWRYLRKPIEWMRKDNKHFAENFQALMEQYQDWLKTDDGKDFRSSDSQTVHALFG
jgi:hypothetical protein